MIEQPPVPKKYFERIWEMKVHYLRAKFYKWHDQRVYFIAGEDTFPWRVLEDKIKDPDHLPQGPIIVNAIYTGQMWRRPGGYYWGESHDRYTIMEFRDVLFEWVNRKDESCSMTCLSHPRKMNKKFNWGFEVEEVLAGGLTLKRMRAGYAYSGRTLAGGSLLKKEPPVPRSTLVAELEKWEDAELKR